MTDTLTRPATVPVETVTPLRPSEAMRLGRLLYPARTTGSLATWTVGRYAVCALGAMEVGFGWSPRGGLAAQLGVLSRAIGRLGPARGYCPARTEAVDCGVWGVRRTPRQVGDVVYHLNDRHRWSTERIADWLEGLGL